MIGPQAATKRVKPLQELGNSVLASRGNLGPVKELGQLGKELNVAAGGVAELRDGITEASNGAGLLALGSDHATEGRAADRQRAGARGGRAASGRSTRWNGSRRAPKNSPKGCWKRKSARSSSASAGINSITNALNYNGRRVQREQLRALRAEQNETLPRLLAPTEASVEKLQAAEAKLKEAAPTDPAAAQALESVQAALAAITGTDPATGLPYAEGYAGLVAELEGLQERLGDERRTEPGNDLLHPLDDPRIAQSRARRGPTDRRAAETPQGRQHAHPRGRQAGQGSGPARQRDRKAERRRDPARQRPRQAERRRRSAGRKPRRGRRPKVEPLESGLTEASVKVLEGKAQIRKQAGEVQDQTPGLFNSGYFVLSALDGAPPGPREKAAPDDRPEQRRPGGLDAGDLEVRIQLAGVDRLNKELAAAAGELGENASLETGVAGGAAQLNDYSHITRERIPWIIAIITLVTFLVLVVVLRALPLAAIAVGLNLLTVGVAFGILTLLFHVPDDWPLGGHNYVDAVGACMIFAIVFGLSIDYAVFLLTRMRERYEAGDDNATAVHYGLDKTARVITGAAVIMLAVFVVFAGAPIATVSQLGIGLTVAVVLDATVVRIVLLPALMLLLGDRVWWLPRPLERVLPKLNV